MARHYIYFFAYGLGVIFIYATYQYLDKVSTNPFRSLKFGDTKGVFIQSEKFIKENIFKETRIKIKSEFRSYDFNYSGVRKLEDLVMEAGGQPLRTIILTNCRSGSSFLGDLLNAMPGTFYHYEPLNYFGCQRFLEPRGALKATNAIKNFLKCNYDNNKSYFMDSIFLTKKRLPTNKRLWVHCAIKEREKLCSDPDFTARFCKLFPFQLMKLTRVRLLMVEELLQAKQLNVKVILLVRDPRAVMQSRRSLSFCQKCSNCIQVEMLCADMVSDYQSASRLLRLYPEQIKVLRYEDLALNLNMTTRQLLKFQRLREMPEIEEFLLTHTNVSYGNEFSTFRVTKDVPFRWKKMIEFDYVRNIQEKCRDAMKLWGYQVAHNATHMQSEEFNPLGVLRLTDTL